ncbi:MAG: hypothetical protein ABJD24_05635, partial [Acidimicrobiales bacterium]
EVPLTEHTNGVEVLNVTAFLTGSIAFVDGGTLDLALVRDSVLNATNDAETFMETMETVAFLDGGDILKLTADVCPDGSTSQTVAVDPVHDGFVISSLGPSPTATVVVGRT